MDPIGPRQRLRITFGRGDPIKYITHLDIMRLWERLLRRARLPVSYSTAQPPRPRLALAAPLAVGVTSEGELLDVFMDARLPLVQLSRRLAAEGPLGITVAQVQEVGLGLPSLQSLVRLSEYRVTVQASVSISEMEQRIAAMLAAPSLPRQRLREKETRSYDLRPQIDSLWIANWDSAHGVLGMLLQTDERAAGRPDEVLSALGAEAEAIHRVRLILAPPKDLEPQRASQPRRHRGAA